MGLFYRVVLWTNMEKTVSMAYKTWRTVGSQLAEAYIRRMAEEGFTYREIQSERVWYQDRGAEMVAGYLKAHCQTQYGWGRETHWEEASPPAVKYRILLVILEEGNFPQSRCLECDMFIP